jgi:uncharacterized protein
MPTARISQLNIYPIKGCRGIELQTATLAATGLEVGSIGDREWVVVDDRDEFLSQREAPKMALITPRLTLNAMEVTAPGMLRLVVPFASEGDVRRVRVWNDEVDAVTQGEIADAWFSTFLGQPCRLMRFDPEAQRLSLRRYTGTIAAPYKFADAFALLICSTASLADLNRRLAAAGSEAVGMERFRPNIVLDGVDPFDEDYVDQLKIGEAALRIVKRCVRCTVPNVDPASGQVETEPGTTLAGYRNDVAEGGITFGVNGIVEQGAGARLQVGDTVDYTLRF